MSNQSRKLGTWKKIEKSNPSKNYIAFVARVGLKVVHGLRRLLVSRESRVELGQTLVVQVEREGLHGEERMKGEKGEKLERKKKREKTLSTFTTCSTYLHSSGDEVYNYAPVPSSPLDWKREFSRFF